MLKVSFQKKIQTDSTFPLICGACGENKSSEYNRRAAELTHDLDRDLQT